MKISVTARSESGGYFEVCASIADVFVEAFEPLKTCDDGVLAMVTLELVPGSVAFERKLKLREDAASKISSALTRMLLEQMQKADTHNGWPKDESH